MKHFLARFRNDVKGVTTVEYAIMIGLVALAVVIGAPNISAAVLGIFSDAAVALNAM